MEELQLNIMPNKNEGSGVGGGVKLTPGQKQGQGQGQERRGRRVRNSAFPAFLALHITNDMYENDLPVLQTHYRATSVSHAVRLLIEDKVKEIRKEREEKQIKVVEQLERV